MHDPGHGLFTASTAPSATATIAAVADMTTNGGGVGGGGDGGGGGGGSVVPQAGLSDTGMPNTGTTSFSDRLTLPNRAVTSSAIEDAYVQFVLYCNPAVPPHTDSTALREAFRMPPRSGGKSFSIYTLFQLICQLEDREIKTWAELALKLGVEPPDQDKGQSSQKIQQYAVRLKRWMHSMHVDAFFDYLMDRPHPYWTQIPPDPSPIGDGLRDGVAAKDDMALRALMPEIKPRRGRRRPDDEAEQDLLSSQSPSQRPRLDESIVDDLSTTAPMTAGTTSAVSGWSAHPDGNNTFVFPPPPQPNRTTHTLPQSHDQQQQQQHLTPPDFSAGGNRGGPLRTPPAGMSWTGGGADAMNTPLSAYPRSALTPSTGHNFWAEEPKSALTPPTSAAANLARRAGRRHGAKVVSSAWRSGGTSAGGIGSGKTRGRPPINRHGNHHHHLSPPGHEGSYFPTSPSLERTTPTFSHNPPPFSSQVNEPPTSAAAPSSTTMPPDLSALQAMSSGMSGGGVTMSPTSLEPTAMAGQQLSLSSSSTATTTTTTTTTDATSPTTSSSAGTSNTRNNRPGRLSLQVPERKGAEVRLASPPGPTAPGLFMDGMHTPALGIALPDASSLYFGHYGANLSSLPPAHGNVVPWAAASSQASGLHHDHNPTAAATAATTTTSAPPTTAAAATNDFPTGANAAAAATLPTPDTTGTSNGSSSGSSNNNNNNNNNNILGGTELNTTADADPLSQKTPLLFGDSNDRTNRDNVENYFLKEILCAVWVDENGQRIPPCSVAEASALVDTIIDDLAKAAVSKEAFLINLAALAGGSFLMAHAKVRVKRTGEDDTHVRYNCDWELRFGDLRGQFSIQELVPHSRQKLMDTETKAAVARAVGLEKEVDNVATAAAAQDAAAAAAAFPVHDTGLAAAAVPGTNPSEHYQDPLSITSSTGDANAPGSAGNLPLNDKNAALAAHWEKKYRDLVLLVNRREQQLARTRASVLQCLRGTYSDDRTSPV
ncbi:ars-binding protein [Niveomyces insectorum RCEF 264]|uniref:Ars-binding protein n=1 Tax=Niveomyces insectorum RCEF 264 TaxID=1081102 RepID=A0A167ZSB0_9HYPO|nr:ars-binding protein [Niveomyces insectorum RCEF 264]